MDIFFMYLKYVLIVAALLVLWAVIGSLFAYRRQNDLMCKLSPDEWLTFEETASLKGRGRFWLELDLENLVKKQRIEKRLSRLNHLDKSLEEFKIVENTTEFTHKNAKLFEYRAIRQPHGPRRESRPGPPMGMTTMGPILPV